MKEKILEDLINLYLKDLEESNELLKIRISLLHAQMGQPPTSKERSETRVYISGHGEGVWLE